LLDSAFSYANEGAVGHAVRTSGVPREDILVTSKLPGRYHEYRAATRAIEESLFRTGLEYLDLYLIHWPNPRQQRYVEAWTALAAAAEKGLVRAIGVSNFQPEHIEHLRAETGLLPVLNQIELHPYFPQDELREYHAARGIVTEAWTPIGHSGDVKSDAVIASIARQHGVRPVQVILRWHVQLGVIPLPKAATQDHQRQNLDVFRFSLSSEHMSKISGLARPDGRTAGQDPTSYEEY
jgi:diketogulonate reductase-like aldo/keto reductase